MPRELIPYADEQADPEASYRRGFQHGAAAVLQLVAGKLSLGTRSGSANG